MIRYPNPKQIPISEFETSFLTPLDENNRWAKLSECIPWEQLAESYYRNFTSHTGRPAKDERLVIGAVIIKHKLCLSDEETILQIQENPYLQYFVGLPGFTMKKPFAPSLLVEIRKRIHYAGKALGRPKKETTENKQQLKQEKAQRRADYLQRIPIEGKFGQGNNGYRLNCIRVKRADTSVAWINSIFLVMNLIVLLRFFFAFWKMGGDRLHRRQCCLQFNCSPVMLFHRSGCLRSRRLLVGG